MGNILFRIIAGILGLWIAVQFVSGVEFTGPWKNLLLAGLILGLINALIKPLIKMITLPLRIITLGLFGLIIELAIVWAIDIFFPELIIKGFFPLLWTTLIVWALGLFFFPKKQND
jgi:putative membrane protein